MDLDSIFRAVRPLYAKHEAACVVLHDERHRYYLGTHEIRAKDGYRTGFGGVEIKKNYVSVHLIPVYVHPELLAATSDRLRRRMQGKSCFNFKKQLEPDLIDELARLIDNGIEHFRMDGRL